MTAGSSGAAGQAGTAARPAAATIASTEGTASASSPYIRTSGMGAAARACRPTGSRRVPQTSRRAPDADSTVCDLPRRVVGVEWHGHRADAQQAQIHATPPRVVVGEDRASVAAADALGQEPSGDGLGHPLQVAIGNALEAVLALHLDGHVPGKAGRRCLEHLPEVRHARIVGQRRRLAAAITAKDPRRHGTSTWKPASRSSLVSCSSVK